MAITLSRLIKTEIPLILVGVLGFITLGEYYIVDPTIKAISTEAGTWVVLISAFMLIMATVRGYLYNMRQIRERRPGLWPYSIHFLIFASIFMVIGVIEGTGGEHYSWMYNWILAGLGTGIFTGYFVIATGYRSFRIRNIHSAALVISMAIFLLYLIPPGDYVPGLFPVGKWLFDVPLTAGFRGILIGSGIGAIYIGLRTIMGRERRVLGA